MGVESSYSFFIDAWMRARAEIFPATEESGSDEDVNIYDPKEIIWSLSTRVDPGKDVILIPAAGSSDTLDISQPVMGEFAGGYFRLRNNIGIDATKPPVIRPMDRALFERAVPMGEGEFPLKDFID